MFLTSLVLVSFFIISGFLCFLVCNNSVACSLWQWTPSHTQAVSPRERNPSCQLFSISPPFSLSLLTHHVWPSVERIWMCRGVFIWNKTGKVTAVCEKKTCFFGKFDTLKYYKRLWKKPTYARTLATFPLHNSCCSEIDSIKLQNLSRSQKAIAP